MRRLAPAAFVIAVSLLLTPILLARQSQGQALDIGTPAFESYIELLRQQSGIPGLSGVLLQDGEVIWERGLGYANVESRIPATSTTPYLVADLTQTVSAALLLQCVEQRRISLDQPVRSYGLTLPEQSTTLRQILSHTWPASSGGTFRYDAARYAQLTTVMEYCAPQPFRKSVAHRVLERFAMIDSVPGRDIQNPDVLPEGFFEESALERYGRVLARLAVPYRVDNKKRTSRTEVPAEGVSASMGLVSSARDLAEFDKGLDKHQMLLEETLNAAWTRVSLPNGAQAPTGLGWFVQTYRGAQVVWQAGVIPNGYSALIVKVPVRRSTMILLANSDGLAVPVQGETIDVTRSLFASVFLRMLL